MDYNKYIVFNFKNMASPKQTPNAQPTKRNLIRTIYFYLVSFVALFMIVFSVVDLVNLGLKTFVFTQADKNMYSYPVYPCSDTTSPDGAKVTTPCPTKEEMEKEVADNLRIQRQQSLVRDVSMLFISLPLYLYHWMIIRRRDM